MLRVQGRILGPFRPPSLEAPSKVPPEAAHLRVLDGLRGFAILLVILPHIEDAGIFPGPDRLRTGIHTFAHGVEIFFVLSGFCLALPLLQRIRDKGEAPFDIAIFFINRVWRIVPLFFAATGLAVAVAVAFRTHVLHGLISAPPPLDVVRSLFLLDRNVEFANATLWSVPVQLRWYLAFPLLIWLWTRAPRLVMALAVGAWIGYLGTRLHTVDLGTLPLFLLGIVAADMYVNRDRRMRWALPMIPFALFLAWIGDHFAVIPDTHGVDSSWTMQPTTIGWQLAAFAFVIAAVSDPRIGRVVAIAPLRWLGIASFSLYLTHEEAIALVGSSTLPYRGIVAFAASLAVGFALYALIERRLVTSSVRRMVRARLLPSASKLLALLGVPHEITLGPGVRPAVEPQLAVLDVSAR
jgi:peptidoglycan/LPS O-acetylase OafA/YrhL